MIDLLVLVALAVFVWWIVGRAAREKRVAQARRHGDLERRLPDPVEPRVSAQQAPSGVTEDVTAVLRRQVPPREVSPRSWLGGLPMMPEHLAWPRGVSSERPEEGEHPLHFVAQVACADLPPTLWGGLGPRSGWLLFFLDPNDGTPDDLGSHAVIHSEELGEVRPAPVDLGPVHDRVYTGGSYAWLPAADVPSVWARWPVDVVTHANQLVDHDGRTDATPDDFATVLYDGAPVRDRVEVRPYTHGQAGAALRALAARMRVGPRPAASDGALELLRSTGRTVTLADHDLYGVDAAGVLRLLEAERDDVRRWQHGVAARCDELADELGERDEPLSEDAWERLRDELADESRSWRELVLRWDGDGSEPRLALSTNRVRAVLEPPRGMAEQATLDWLDPERRSLVPAEVHGDLAARARALYDNRPHRMGGYHDGVQSDAVEGPQQRLLLLQLASDRGMDWCWGDVGAYYFFIRPEHLAAGDFSSVEMWLESH